MDQSGVRVLATGSFLPASVIENSDLSQFPISSHELIECKTGIKARRHASPNQCTSDLAFEAARVCMSKTEVSISCIDAIILATSSPDRIQPATATRVQDRLGATQSYAFDVNSVCTGAVFSICIAYSMIISGQAKYILVLAAELYSRFLNPNDFSTYPYFGDGAGAVLLGPSKDAEGNFLTILGTDGAGHNIIEIPAGGSMKPSYSTKDEREFFFRMNGREVYKFAVSKGSHVINELLKRGNCSPRDISAVIPHQANLSIIRAISENVAIPLDKFVVNLDRFGNTAAASVLIALDEAYSNGRLKPGQKAIIVAFGGGLSWGGILFTV